MDIYDIQVFRSFHFRPSIMSWQHHHINQQYHYVQYHSLRITKGQTKAYLKSIACQLLAPGHVEHAKLLARTTANEAQHIICHDVVQVLEVQTAQFGQQGQEGQQDPAHHQGRRKRRTSLTALLHLPQAACPQCLITALPHLLHVLQDLQ
jgi:hypothetical protein